MRKFHKILAPSFYSPVFTVLKVALSTYGSAYYLSYAIVFISVLGSTVSACFLHNLVVVLVVVVVAVVVVISVIIAPAIF